MQTILRLLAAVLRVLFLEIFNSIKDEIVCNSFAMVITPDVSELFSLLSNFSIVR